MRFLKRLLLILGLLYLLALVAVYAFQEALLFHPTPLPEDHTLQIPGDFEELEIPVEEGVYLNSALFRTDGPKGLLLYFHGNAGTVERCSPIAQRFLQQKWDVLIVDYRSFGKSDGALDGQSFLSDALDCYDFSTSSLGYDTVVVYGQSIGSGLAASVAAQRDVAALCLEAPYYSMRDLASEKVPWLPIDLVLRYPLLTNEYLKDVHCPTIIFHGHSDAVIPFSHSQRLKSEFPSIHLVELVAAGHNNCSLYPQYQVGLRNFLAMI